MNGLSLFSGAAIGELALKQIIPNYRTVGYVEWDTYCQEVIRARIKDGILDDAPIFNDIRVFNERFGNLYTGKVDWLSGGFPCQPFSVAGRQLGEADERNMWPATRDAISIIRPRYAFLENVAGLLVHEYIHTIFGELAEIGYDCQWDIVGADYVGGIHRRRRLWILAHADGQRCEDTLSGRQEIRQPSGIFTRQAWSGLSKSSLHRTGDGVASRVDRLKALGNGWVPQVVARILQITKQENIA